MPLAEKARNFRLSASDWTLVLSNFVPLIGALFFSWTLFNILIAYWLESGVIGIFNVFKMMKVKENPGVKLHLIPFFTIHYGSFMLGHLFLLFIFFGVGQNFATRSFALNLGFAAIALLISHGVSYFSNYIGKGEYNKVTVNQLMGKPYNRILAMQFALIVGGFIFVSLGRPTRVLSVLVIAKILIDLNIHLREHKTANNL